MRGGQVTLFAIVGLVLLITVGLIYLIAARAGDDVSPTARGTADVAVLSSFLGSCVDTVVAEQLGILGRNGGTFSLEGYPSATVAGQRMRYGLTRNNDAPGTGALRPYALPAPQYPEWGIKVLQSDIDGAGVPFAQFQDGYFGDTYFPAICSKTGANRPGSTFTCRSYEGNPPGTPGPNTQELLERRVRDGVRSCANLRAFEEAIGSSLERVGDPNVTITYTFSNILVKLTYPVVVSGEEQTRLEDFRRDYRVRYLPVAQFASDLAKEESRNATFNLSRHYPNVRSYRPGFTVSANYKATASDPSAGIETPKATLVTVFDSSSTMDGQSYAFSFLIEHRAPMLSNPLTVQQGENAYPDGYLPDATLIAADPDDGPVLVQKEHDGLGNLRNVTVTDADGEMDWQDF